MNTKIWLVISLILALSMFGGMAHAADGEADRLVEQCKSAITFSGPLAPQDSGGFVHQYVRAGVNLPSVWDQLQGQLYLGDAKFAEALGKKIDVRLSADAEIPRLQRRASAPPLTEFAAMPARNPAIVQAYATGCYSMKEIAQAFDVHSATVSRIVKWKAINV